MEDIAKVQPISGPEWGYHKDQNMVLRKEPENKISYWHPESTVLNLNQQLSNEVRNSQRSTFALNKAANWIFNLENGIKQKQDKPPTREEILLILHGEIKQPNL